MYARLTTGTIHHDKIDDATKYLHDHVAEVRQLKGNHDFLGLLDRGSGKLLILTLWDSEADLQASETSGYYQARIKELTAFAVGQFTRDAYEVTADDISGLGEAKAVRVVMLPLMTDKIDECIGVFRTSIIPAARQQNAWRRLLNIVDRATGKSITFSFWESESALRASESDGFYQAQLAKVLPMSTGQPTREIFDVAAQATIPAPMGQPQPYAPNP